MVAGGPQVTCGVHGDKRYDRHLRFLAVRRMLPRWWFSIKLRIWGVTSVPSQPIISIWPMAL